MEYLKIVSLLLVFSTVMSACNDEFLTRTPMDEVSEQDFFKTPQDLRTFVNQFYNNSSFPIYEEYGFDYDSNSLIASNPNSRLEGTRVVGSGGGISYSKVREVNYFFDNYKKVEENAPFDEYEQYLGEAYFFRAVTYFDLLRSYGDVLWLEATVDTDSPELYEPRDPRNIVADNIVADLDSAATYLTPEKTNGASRVNKWMALLIQSRVALYEGTWEKYHANGPFGVGNPQPEKYFSKAVEAAEQIMDSGLYDIFTSDNPNADYYNLFSMERNNYASNPEVMFWKEFDNSLGEMTRDINYRMRTPANHGVTKQLADAYLSTDGDPISVSSLFEGYESLSDEVKNRDPRMSQTIATPDSEWQIEDGTIRYYDELFSQINTSYEFTSPTGYILRKGYDPRVENHITPNGESPSIIYRYAEVLLNFAEAKAELRTITQSDINKSIKKLRDRVGMPNLVLGAITNDPQWNFPDLSPVINEIRRERWVELAAEGFRWDDIARWAAAEELIVGKRPKGTKASQFQTDNPYPVDENGFLDPYKDQIPSGYGFKVERDYLDPISKEEIELSDGNLEQNPGWE